MYSYEHHHTGYRETSTDRRADGPPLDATRGSRSAGNDPRQCEPLGTGYHRPWALLSQHALRTFWQKCPRTGLDLGGVRRCRQPAPSDFVLEGLIRWERVSESGPLLINSEDLLAQVSALLRPERTTVLPSVSANHGQSEVNPSKQESLNQELFMQAVTQWLQTQILENVGAVVLVVLNGNLRTRPSSPNQKPRDRHTRSGGDCCDEYPSMYKTLRQRQGA